MNPNFFNFIHFLLFKNSESKMLQGKQTSNTNILKQQHKTKQLKKEDCTNATWTKCKKESYVFFCQTTIQSFF